MDLCGASTLSLPLDLGAGNQRFADERTVDHRHNLECMSAIGIAATVYVSRGRNPDVCVLNGTAGTVGDDVITSS